MIKNVTFPYIYILNMRSFIQGFCGIDSKSFKEEFDEKNSPSDLLSSISPNYVETLHQV